MEEMNIPAVTGYVSVQEAANIIGCSGKRVYQYIRDGRLSAFKVGHMLVLPLKEVQSFKPGLPGRARSKTPIWRAYRSRGKLLTTVIQVQVRKGQQEKLREKLNAIDQEQYTFAGTITRYILGDNETIKLVLIGKNTEMPDDITQQQDFRSFQQGFADVLDWETIHICSKDVLLHT